ncbi:iron-sulfur cluster insertion protein ErpA [Candidatus Uabimicrobium sp. HlEnr_7]|uniref:iron-sulfur cluster insertion protein ErpA n=1 Tax=Candidatus Uabimicrobium helgolandensis TaxID=3095367 RepID=UPI003558F993
MINIIQITEASAKQIQKIREDDSISDNKFLRVSVVGGGCSGFSYDLSFDDTKREDDIIVSEHGAQLYVDAKSALYLSGTTLDYSSGLNGKGFEFTNPNAVRTCGCGSSFAI